MVQILRDSNIIFSEKWYGYFCILVILGHFEKFDTMREFYSERAKHERSINRNWESAGLNNKAIITSLLTKIKGDTNCFK